METTALFQTLNSIGILSPALKDRISGMMVEEVVKKRTLILKQGQVARRISFINQGTVRAFYDKGDETFTNWFMSAGDFIISVYSFFSQKPSFETIVALEDCTLLSISWDQLQDLYKEFPEFNLIGRIITEQYYIRSEERAIDLQTLTATQRYEKLIATYPNILQKATLGQIASYLSIKQETLSRIRGKR
ncbi:Crp/Fnr family transcriptional regulator [Mucilaginibacter myungsuensis]|uniref:Crp/Fnr family transcriptional regulator n=1 Tax=Mucilaginibacter myungsuensis TaxID=649104 RepID=A0A929PVT2_9SPHI|nr:Crp/Fnr family transcriptional regulator [Mucilaginibacter myungsuensis]MBE9661356.1 Crp/Fnr family transcriptional regulator [Mucilaginibacter myungsuensis]MDN3597499.1 Crp/Fnr family transcriptional regulator [Mucilaginibacter myungsuensis]